MERVIAQNQTVKGIVYLTKWRGLPYSESTWESPADLKDDTVDVFDTVDWCCGLFPSTSR